MNLCLPRLSYSPPPEREASPIKYAHIAQQLQEINVPRLIENWTTQDFSKFVTITCDVFNLKITESPNPASIDGAFIKGHSEEERRVLFCPLIYDTELGDALVTSLKYVEDHLTPCSPTDGLPVFCEVSSVAEDSNERLSDLPELASVLKTPNDPIIAVSPHTHDVSLGSPTQGTSSQSSLLTPSPSCTSSSEEDTDDSSTSRKPKLRLWQFLFELLEGNLHSDKITWTDHDQLIFKFLKRDAVAELWQKCKPRKSRGKKMTYKSLSRSLRSYYKKGQGIIEHSDESQMMFYFNRKELRKCGFRV